MIRCLWLCGIDWWLEREKETITAGRVGAGPPGIRQRRQEAASQLPIKRRRENKTVAVIKRPTGRLQGRVSELTSGAI